MTGGLTHFDEAPTRDRNVGHLRGRWTFLGEAGGAETIGVRRIQLPADGWSTPAHQHGKEEEIFYVLAGSGVSWQAGETTAIGPGDCIVYHPGAGAHTLHADEHLDVLAFGTREWDEAIEFDQLDIVMLNGRAVHSERRARGGPPIQFLHEAEQGPPPLPPRTDPPGPRPPTIVNLNDVEPVRVEHGRIARVRRNLGRAAGSKIAGLQHVVVDPGRESAPPHCHSVQEELFVILEGEGRLVLDDDPDAATPVRSGHVVCRPAATRVSHMFVAGETPLTYLAYGTRDPSDVCFYPRSGKIAIHGVGVIGRIEPLDYWDGEG